MEYDLKVVALFAGKGHGYIFTVCSDHFVHPGTHCCVARMCEYILP